MRATDWGWTMICSAGNTVENVKDRRLVHLRPWDDPVFLSYLTVWGTPEPRSYPEPAGGRWGALWCSLALPSASAACGWGCPRAAAPSGSTPPTHRRCGGKVDKQDIKVAITCQVLWRSSANAFLRQTKWVISNLFRNFAYNLLSWGSTLLESTFGWPNPQTN